MQMWTVRSPLSVGIPGRVCELSGPWRFSRGECMKHVRVVIAALLFVHGVVAQERADAHSKYVVPATIVEPAAPVPSAGNPPAIGVFAGASASLVDLGDLGHHGAYGWETSVSSTVYRWFAIEGAVGGYYSLQTSAMYGPALVGFNEIGMVKVTTHYRDYSFLGGPRINLPKGLFFHALFGEADSARTSALV
jgi:hypothetical protein